MASFSQPIQDVKVKAISWHVAEVLNQKKALKGKTVKRVAFNAITKEAVLDAASPVLGIDEGLWSMHILHAVHWIILSASRFLRQFCGANCRARSAGHTFSQWRCAISLRIADPRSNASSVRNTECWRCWLSRCLQFHATVSLPVTARNSGKPISRMVGRQRAACCNCWKAQN